MQDLRQIYLADMCKAIEFGVPVDQAIFAATRNPARSIGIYDRTGSVHTGKEADILLLTENFELKELSDIPAEVLDHHSQNNLI